MSQSDIEEMMRAHDGGEDELRRKLADARTRWEPEQSNGPVEIRISLKRDTEDASSGWTSEVRWHGDEWATIHAATRGRALDLIAGYVRAA